MEEELLITDLAVEFVRNFHFQAAIGRRVSYKANQCNLKTAIANIDEIGKYIEYLKEEVREMEEAFDKFKSVKEENEFEYRKHYKALLDAIGDVEVLNQAIAAISGADLAAVLRAVNDSNYSKLDKTPEDASLTYNKCAKGDPNNYYQKLLMNDGGLYGIFRKSDDKLMKSYKFLEPLLQDLIVNK
jgi:hypothetical protein